LICVVKPQSKRSTLQKQEENEQPTNEKKKQKLKKNYNDCIPTIHLKNRTLSFLKSKTHNEPPHQQTSQLKNKSKIDRNKPQIVEELSKISDTRSQSQKQQTRKD
jgi:hypothetical protein